MTANDPSPVLHGVVQLRHWLQNQLPAVGPTVAEDLFLEVAERLAEGQAVDIDTLAAALPHSRALIGAQLKAMEKASLLQPRPRGPGIGGGWRIEPTARFVALVQAYEQQVRSHFIVREPLRNEQLHVSCRDAHLAALARLLYDRCFDLGWLYLHQYGSICFMMATLLCALVERRGHRARIELGYVEVASDKGVFLLGRRVGVRPGQIDGHATCVIDDALVLDFGLGNLRREYKGSFFWGLGADLLAQGPLLAQLALPGGDTVRWKSDWSPPAAAAELGSCQAVLPRLMADYRQRFSD